MIAGAGPADCGPGSVEAAHQGARGDGAGQRIGGEGARVAAELTRTHSIKTIAGGGDTIAALNQANVFNDFTYVSTAGGAFLEWLEGKLLPGVEALRGQKAA